MSLGLGVLSLDNIQAFLLWLLDEIPAFLMSEPICYFVGMAFLLVTIKLFIMITKIR
mgnify:CR=1 FL=1